MSSCFNLIYTSSSKVYQEGENSNEPCNIHRNQICPEHFTVIDFLKFLLEYPTLLNSDCNLWGRFIIKPFYNKNDVVQENEDGFYAFKVDVSDLGYHYSRKGATTLWTPGYTMATHITYICLCVVWSIINLKIWYFQYDVACNQFYDWAVTGINPAPYDFSVSCCCIYLDK